MPLHKTLKPIAAYALATSAGAAFAHEGHGLLGPHWHATDLWGFVALALAVGAVLWWHRSGK